MQISVVSYEKHRNSALEAAEQEYIKRLSRQARVALCPGKAQGGLPDRLLKGTYVVGLYVEGESFTSEQLAQRLQRLMNQGHSHLVLVIGEAEGMPTGVASQLQEQWSLSPLTFSHQLARLLLLEALYRSFDILRGGRYHK
jgi:23S rRNA (pseudouridine1915-N3)-methyltransferase